MREEREKGSVGVGQDKTRQEEVQITTAAPVAVRQRRLEAGDGHWLMGYRVDCGCPNGEEPVLKALLWA